MVWLETADVSSGVVGSSDGTTRGGHLMEADVWPTLEVIGVEVPQHLRRVYDAASPSPLKFANLGFGNMW